MAASQTELPYCSDKETGNGVGGGRGVDTPAPAAGARAATVTSSRQNTTEPDSNVSPASHPAIRGHLRTHVRA